MDSVPGSTCSPVFVFAEALPARQGAASGPGLFGQPVCPSPAVCTWARTGSLRFPGVPSRTSARLSDPGRIGRTSPFAVLSMLPPDPTRRRLQHEHDVGAQPRASVPAAYASRAASPSPVQGSLPAGGLRLYREGVEPSGPHRKVSGYIRPPFQDFPDASWVHAVFMPVAARPVGRLPPSFVPGQQLEPGFGDVPERFRHVINGSLAFVLPAHT